MKAKAQLRMIVLGAVLAVWLAPATLATVCVVPDSGGTATMPPPVGTPNCTTGYVSPMDFHEIVNGLPAGSTILVGAEHNRFINVASGPGGPLGGEQETFDSDLVLQLEGTGTLAGFSRTLLVPIACTTAIGPRTAGDPIQTFPNEMVQLQGSIFGDPDFDVLTIRAGSQFGLPSPGQTTLTRLGPPGGDFNVDSFFDITYTIEFQGAPGSLLAGSAGTTQGTLRMGIGEAVTATPASGGMGLLVAALALAFLIPVVLYVRRTRMA